MEEGADPNIFGDNELSPLLLSCYQGYNEVYISSIDPLLQHFDMSFSFSDSFPPYLQIVDVLLRHGASLLPPNSSEPKWTALHAAVFGKHVDVCHTLMRDRDRRRREEKRTMTANMTPDIAIVGNEEGRTPGHFVALYGSGNVGSGKPHLLIFSLHSHLIFENLTEFCLNSLNNIYLFDRQSIK